jgi:fructokinase
MTELITSMGEILIDFLPIEEAGRTVGFKMHPGGSPLNVAVGLARLGQPTAFASKVSSDLFGRYLREYVESEGIDTRFLPTIDAPTTLAFVSMEGNEPAYAFYSEGAADTLLTPEAVPDALFEESRVLHFGSISLLRGTTPAAVLATAERLKGKALLSFDPNIRPGLVRDEAAYRSLLDKLFTLADIVKMSAADIAWLSPGESLESTATKLLAAGATLVVVTQGSQETWAFRQGEKWQVPTVGVHVVDTVGAGDAFSSGLLASLAERGVTSRNALEQIRSEELAACLHFAAVTAALTCMRPGADPPTRAEAGAFLSG